MSEGVARHMTLEEFLTWQKAQETRCELIDGRPVAMTGATFAHDLVVGNLRAALRDHLRTSGSTCRSFGADIGVIISPTTLRRPDVTIYCPPFDYGAATSNQPRLITEVLSRSTEHVDYFVKVEEYKTIPTLQVILLVSPQAIDLGLWTRNGDDWHYRQTRDGGSSLDLVDLGIRLPVRDIYEDVELKPPYGPRLVWPDETYER